MSRLPQFNTDDLNDEQATIYNKIVSGPRGKFGGPFLGLIHAPHIADQVQSLGASLRFNTKLQAAYREVAILTAARFWHSEVEWNAHVVIAMEQGVPEKCILDILYDNKPSVEKSECNMVFNFCREILNQKIISQKTYQETSNSIGVEQVVELVALLGYFSLLAMLLNAFEIPSDPLDGVPPAEFSLSNIISN